MWVKITNMFNDRMIEANYWDSEEKWDKEAEHVKDGLSDGVGRQNISDELK